MHHRKHGFTIIEVSLVLAIAGLILIMAFVAVPALQRQARDAKRKDDTMTYLQALKKYQQNNRGQLPKVEDDLETRNESTYNIDRSSSPNKWEDNNNPWAVFYNQYLGDDFTNPDGEKYTFAIQTMDAYNPGQTDPFKCHDMWFDYGCIVGQGFEDRLADFYIFMKATCENGEALPSNNRRNLAIVTILESGSAYCANL